jgi:hypothetical protein
MISRQRGPATCFNRTNMRIAFHKALAASFLIFCLTLTAQEKGVWGAVSSNARSITGDVELSNEKISIDFVSFTMARIRSLDKAELSAAFDADSNANGAGSLYRLQVPAARKFLHKNSLCVRRIRSGWQRTSGGTPCSLPSSRGRSRRSSPWMRLRIHRTRAACFPTAVSARRP